MKAKTIVLWILALCLLPAALAWADCQKGEALYNQAMAEKDLRARAAILERSLSQCPNFNAYYELGQAYLWTDQLHKADLALREAHATVKPDALPARAKVLAARGQLAQKQGRYMEASSFLRASLKVKNTPAVADHLKQMEVERLNKLESAREIVRGLRGEAERAFGVQPSVNLRVNFEYDRWELTPEGQRQAQELGKALSDSSFTGTQRFLLLGHTDKRGGPQYNLELSRKRAETVQRYVESQFPALAGRVQIQAMGLTSPLYQGDSEEVYSLNRRVEVRLQ